MLNRKDTSLLSSLIIIDLSLLLLFTPISKSIYEQRSSIFLIRKPTDRPTILKVTRVITYPMIIIFKLLTPDSNLIGFHWSCYPLHILFFFLCLSFSLSMSQWSRCRRPRIPIHSRVSSSSSPRYYLRTSVFWPLLQYALLSHSPLNTVLRPRLSPIRLRRGTHPRHTRLAGTRSACSDGLPGERYEGVCLRR